MNYILSAISGVLLMLCFPEYNLSWLAFIALIPLFIALSNTRSIRRSALYGFVTGLIYFGGVLNWIKIVGLWVGPLYGILAWLALIMFQSLFIALFGALYRLLSDITEKKVREPVTGYALMFLPPVLWMVIEWLRASGPFAVTAGDLVYSQYTLLPFIQIASIVGSFGVTFLIVLVDQILAALISALLIRDGTCPFSRKVLTISAFIALFLISMTVLYGRYAIKAQELKDDSAKKINVAVFQPNIAQDQKMDQTNFPAMKDLFVQETKQLIREHTQDLIIWPETIVPELLLRDRAFIFRIKEAARSYILFGTPTLFGRDIFNSMVLINPQGREVGFYHKRHLAPFGEYLPFRALLLPFLAGTDFFSNDYTPGAEQQDLITPWGRIAAGICFESILPRSMRTQTAGNAAFIVVITNDAWFKQTAALEEHLSMSVLRAVENRKTLVQSANTGYSAFISSTGRIVQRSQIERRQWLCDTVPLRQDVSLYGILNDLPVLFGMLYVLYLMTLAMLYWYGVLRDRRKERLRVELHEER